MKAKYLLYLFIVFYCVSCDVSADSKPDQYYNWERDGFGEWGCGGNYMYGTYDIKKDNQCIDIIEAWKWTGNKFVNHKKTEMGEWSTNCVAWITEDYYISSPFRFGKKDPNDFIAVINSRNKIVRQWPTEYGWYCNRMGHSRNGMHIAFCLIESFVHKPVDYNRNRPRVRFGVIGPELGKISELVTIKGTQSSCNIRQIAVSDDGKYVAAAGWDSGAIVLDMVKKKKLWQLNGKRMKETYLRAITFSPDNKYVYAGGTTGCVYQIDLQSHNILKRLWTTSNNKPLYGHRIRAVAVSPDGRFVAAGTAPTGRTCVWDTKTGKRVKLINNGSGIFMMMFTPDSKNLATFDGGSIKVWKISEE